MEHEGHFQTRDGQEFYERRWDAEVEVPTHLVLVHGYGEHCSRYAEVAQRLNANGITVHTYDQRGFGRSPGKRAAIGDFDLLLQDLDDYLEFVRPRFDGKPWFVMGHSLGGLVLTRYLETRTVDARGVVFSSPFLAFSDDVPEWLLSLANVLGTLVPWLPVGRVDNSGLSRDPAAVEAADNDPLSYHGWVHAGTGRQFHRAITQACAEFGKITLPAYIIHGGEDRVVSKEGSVLLHDGIQSEDKALKIIEGGYHELWNDLDKVAVIDGIAEWVLGRVPRSQVDRRR